MAAAAVAAAVATAQEQQAIDQQQQQGMGGGWFCVLGRVPEEWHACQWQVQPAAAVAVWSTTQPYTLLLE
jgi:hypothetical protein